MGLSYDKTFKRMGLSKGELILLAINWYFQFSFS